MRAIKYFISRILLYWPHFSKAFSRRLPLFSTFCGLSRRFKGLSRRFKALCLLHAPFPTGFSRFQRFKAFMRQAPPASSLVLAGLRPSLLLYSLLPPVFRRRFLLFSAPHFKRILGAVSRSRQLLLFWTWLG